MQTRKLIGKVALVTGASSGIGEATALALAAEGARVAVAARRRQPLNDLVERIRQRGCQALTIEADVTDEAQALARVQRVQQDGGRLDVLANMVGVGVAPFQNTTTTEYHQMVNINILDLLYSIHATLPTMKARQGNGPIVLVSSGTGCYIALQRYIPGRSTLSAP